MTTILIFCVLWGALIIIAACLAARNGDTILASRNFKTSPTEATLRRHPARRRFRNRRTHKLGRLLHVNNAVK